MINDTSREILDKVLKRREELRIEAEALDNLIETYRHMIVRSNSVDSASGDQLDLSLPTSRRAMKAAQQAEMWEAARRLILTSGQPMRRGELRERLEKQGFRIQGADKNKVFGTNLWRSKKFVMVEGRGYWPADLSPPD